MNTVDVPRPVRDTALEALTGPLTVNRKVPTRSVPETVEPVWVRIKSKLLVAGKPTQAPVVRKSASAVQF